jgi:hypothetical protein
MFDETLCGLFGRVILSGERTCGIDMAQPREQPSKESIIATRVRSPLLECVSVWPCS